MRVDRIPSLPLSRLGAYCLLLGSLLCEVGLAVFPSLQELRPRGAQRGTAFKLTLVGSGLIEGLRVQTTLPAFFTPLTVRSDVQGQSGEEVLFLVELAKDTPIAQYPIRVITPTGMSNLLLFSVGEFPEVHELEDAPSGGVLESSQPVDLPTTVNGSLAGPDRDAYRFQATAADQIVLEVEGRRAGSALDPVLRLFDAQLRQLAFSDDALGLGSDARIDFRVPTDGEYQVVIHDARFSRQEQNFYRLKIGPVTYAEGLFPLGWRRGEEVSVEFLGGNLGMMQSKVDLASETKDLIRVGLSGDAGSFLLPFVVGDLPEVLEQEGARSEKLDPGTVVNGRILSPGEVDRYRLAVAPGEFWAVELQAATLGTSRLFGRITVVDGGGRRLGSAGDDSPGGDDFRLVVIGPTSPDPYLCFEVPPKTEEVVIEVEDLVGRGGALFGYRLWARRERPDFTLALQTAFVNVPESGTGWVDISVHRRGYHGQIQLDIPDAGPDLIVEGGMVGPEPNDSDTRSVVRNAMISLTARPGTSPGVRQLRVRGRVFLPDGSVIERWAEGPGLLTDVAVGTGIPDPSLRMTEQPFSAPWLGLSLPVMVTKEVPVRLVLENPPQTRLLQGMAYDLKWRYVASDPAIELPNKVVAKSLGGIELKTRVRESEEEGAGTVSLLTTIGTRPSKFNMVVSGEVELDGGKHLVRSRSVTIEVVQGYRLVVQTESFLLQPGSETDLLGKLERDPLFDQPVTIKPEGFPRGVLCSPVEVPADVSEFRISCRAESWVSPGEYSIELSSSSVLARREKEKVPYSIPPVPASLVVSSPADAGQASRSPAFQ